MVGGIVACTVGCLYVIELQPRTDGFKDEITLKPKRAIYFSITEMGVRGGGGGREEEGS